MERREAKKELSGIAIFSLAMSPYLLRIDWLLVQGSTVGLADMGCCSIPVQDCKSVEEWVEEHHCSSDDAER